MARIVVFLSLLLAGCAATTHKVCDCTVSSNPDIDRAAYVALSGYPKTGEAEYFSAVYDGGYVPEPQVLGRTGGMGGVAADPLAILHTHPIIRDREWHGDNSRKPAEHDVNAVLQLGIPNYYRSHNGRHIVVIEIIDGVVSTRTVR